MPQQTKIFRVFVSSTFTDMKEERKFLMNDVFPKLEKLCSENNAKFQAVDLRWGVTEESQKNQKTLQICLNEVARCQRISPKPNFLVLLGDKYGWQPIPEKIPESEWNQIIRFVTVSDLELLNRWYKKDENAIPAEYLLQARSDIYEEYTEWEVIDKQIRKLLQDAVKQTGLSEKDKIKYFASATHQEILKGALNPPENIEHPNEHVFAFVRETNKLPKDNTAEGFIDLVDGKHDTEAEEMLDNLKSDLNTHLADNYILYTANWKQGKAEINNAEAFINDIYNKLKTVLQEQFSKVDDKDEITHEAKLHTEFKDKLVKYFKGRKETLQHIHAYLNDEASNKVLSLIGESGSGKSSIMAKAIENENSKNIVFRFLGTSSGSSNVISMLQSVAGQIAKAFNKNLKEFTIEGDEKALHDLYGISEVFKKVLSLATPQQPIIVFLDALDQLSDTDNAKSLFWLPKELPNHVRLIVSSLPELKSNLSDTQIEELPILPKEEAEIILKGWLASIDRTLTDEQFNYTIDKFEKTPLAIYLKMAFENAKNWGSYFKEYKLSETVEDIITDFFENMETEFPKEFVKHAVCYMLCGRYQGLAENEILDILAFDEEHWDIFLKQSHKEHRDELAKAKKIPIAVWSRLYLDLEPFLTERDADGVPIITFFHRQFNEVLRKKYGLEENVEEK